MIESSGATDNVQVPVVLLPLDLWVVLARDDRTEDRAEFLECE